MCIWGKFCTRYAGMRTLRYGGLASSTELWLNWAGSGLRPPRSQCSWCPHAAVVVRKRQCSRPNFTRFSEVEGLLKLGVMNLSIIGSDEPFLSYGLGRKASRQGLRNLKSRG